MSDSPYQSPQANGVPDKFFQPSNPRATWKSLAVHSLVGGAFGILVNWYAFSDRPFPPGLPAWLRYAMFFVLGAVAGFSTDWLVDDTPDE